MNTLVLKLILTPALIGAVSLAGRRWGPAVGGWLTGLPLTSGPVALYLALEQGAAFAATAALGILAGLISVAAFCLTYGRLAPGWDCWRTVLASVLAFLASTWLLQHVRLPLPVASVGVVAVLVVVLRLLAGGEATGAHVAPPAWDIPARMLVATTFVLVLTGLADAMGPWLSGLLAPLPIFAGTLAVFTHRLQGAAAATRLIRGVVLGSFAFAAFFAVVATLIEPVGILAAFAGATTAALLVQWATRSALGSS